MRVIDKGREYATDDGQALRFIGLGQTGTTTEEVIDILVDRLLAQQQVLADGFTDRAVTQLLRAKAQLVSRAQVRAEGGITGKPQRTESVIASVREAEAEHRRVADREAAHGVQD